MEVEQRQESSKYERVRVKQELQHPNFNRNTLQYDAMLIILEHPPSFLSDLDPDTNFTFMKLHRPDTMNVTEMIDGRITSPTDRTDTVSQEQLIALGWGHTQTGQGPRASFLQQASLGYVPNDVCELSRENSASYQNRIHDDMMCTFASGRDTCNGDSGGPIIIPGLTPAEDVQVGIVSWYVRRRKTQKRQ
jgi:secreted trypsin-like serine protease